MACASNISVPGVSLFTSLMTQITLIGQLIEHVQTWLVAENRHWLLAVCEILLTKYLPINKTFTEEYWQVYVGTAMITMSTFLDCASDENN